MITDSKTVMSTIVSRISKKPAVIENYAGKGKTVVETIDILANKWNELTSKEKAEISIDVAGRYHMGRFAALMENHNSEENKHSND